MISKKIVMSFIAMFLVFSVASALTIVPDSVTLNPTSNHTTLTLKNDNNVSQDVSFSISSIVDGTNTVSFVPIASINDIANASEVSFNLAISQIVGSLKFGKDYSTTLTAVGKDNATGDTVSNAIATINFQTSFCSKGSAGGNLSVDNIDINNEGQGKDDEWNFLDTITVEVKVENNGDDIDDVFVKLGLFDSTGNEVSNDLDFISADDEEIELGDLSDGDDDTVTFEFQVPADFESGNYKLAIKAFSKDLGESNECDDSSSDLSDTTFDSISVEKETDEGKFITFDNEKLSPSEATCGDTVILTADAYNVGDKDQDRVKVTLLNNELGVDQIYEIKNNLDQGDKERVTFTFDIPNTAVDKTYRLELSSDYDYRNGNYRETSDEDFVVPLQVIGCSPQSAQTGRIASISASLDSDAKPGQTMSVTATIKNLGTSAGTFTVSAEGYDSWADLNDISDRTLTLSPGESQDVTIEFDVADDASGDNSFTIEVTSNGKTESRDVQVTVESSSLGSTFGGNSLIWVIGLVNLVLIIIIVIVAVRLSRK